MPNVSLYIKRDNNSVYIPITCDGIQLESEREGSPAKLTFTVVKDQIISFPEGVPVALYVDGKGIFQGYVFQKSRDKEHHIQCVAYDQLRYFKNKWTYKYENKTASEVLMMIAKDFNLETGIIEDTKFKIDARYEQDMSLFDIVLNALAVTVANSKDKESYVLYDDFGKLTLKNLKSMRMNLLVDDSTCENFDYTSSIDEDTYNQVLLYVEDDETTDVQTKQRVYFAEDPQTIKGWGVLRHTETVGSGVNASEMAKNILKLKNRKTRNLELKGVLGDINVRAGCSLPVHLNIGDIRTQDLKKLLVCDRVIHYFNGNDHVMDLTLWDANTFTG